VAYDEELANRIRELVALEPGLSEKRMFGGLAFLIGGNMSVAASGRGGLLVRVGPDRAAAAEARPHASAAVMRGRTMNGWVRVDDAGIRTKRQLEKWVRESVAFARTLPAKGAGPRRSRGAAPTARRPGSRSG
jgi:TfoX/Sxy family transcriptional regulator of competence genes